MPPPAPQVTVIALPALTPCSSLSDRLQSVPKLCLCVPSRLESLPAPPLSIPLRSGSESRLCVPSRLESLPAAELRVEVERLLGLVDRLSAVYRPPAAALRCRQLRPLLSADLEPPRAAVSAAGRRLLAAAGPRQLVSAVTQLGGAITQLVDQLLLLQLRLLTEALRPPHVLSCARAALAAATAAGAQGCHLSGLFCRLGGVRQLAGMATDSRFSPLQLHVLRALSAVCCAVPCVRAMEQVRHRTGSGAWSRVSLRGFRRACFNYLLAVLFNIISDT